MFSVCRDVRCSLCVEMEMFSVCRDVRCSLCIEM